MFKNITQTQWVAFVIGAASFLGGATAQLTTLFGANGASYVASACALISGLAGVFLMATTGQASNIASVQAIATGPASSTAAAAQDAIIKATSAIAQDKSIPTSQAAANSLVAATIALPQVQGIVTDKTTSKAVNNPSVISQAA